MRRRALVMMVGLGVQLASLAGCSSQGDSGVAGSSDLSQGGGGAPATRVPTAASSSGSGGSTAASNGAPAVGPITVASHPVAINVAGCSADGQLPVISAATPAVSDAITKALQLPAEATLCANASADFPQEVSVSFEVGANGNGIFSMSWLENILAASHGFEEEGHTFDAATGKELALADVFTPDGIKVIQGACADGLVAQGDGQISADDAAAMCGAANLGFMLKDAGVRAMPELGAGFAAIELDPLPWSKLSGKVQPIAVDYAKAHGG